MAGACLVGASLAIASTRSRTVPMTANDTVNVPVHCPSGTSVKGFGGRGQTPTTFGEQLIPTGMSRPGPRQAVLSAANDSSTATQNFRAFAYCGHEPHLSEVSNSARIRTNSQGSTTARCPRGTSVMLGGFNEASGTSHGDPFVTIEGLERTSARTWTAKATNGGHRGRLTALAYCASGTHRLTEVDDTVRIRPDHAKTATATCHRGHRFVMGGFSDQHYSPLEGNILITSMKRSGRRGWAVTGYRTQVPAGHLTAIAYCSA
jgi:hypothetical protein